MFFDECHSPLLEVFSWPPYEYWQDHFQNDRQDLPKNLEIHKDYIELTVLYANSLKYGQWGHTICEISYQSIMSTLTSKSVISQFSFVVIF